ncbi:Uncharacterised protein, partial [Metamycoplasma alkalescens]
MKSRKKNKSFHAQSQQIKIKKTEIKNDQKIYQIGQLTSIQAFKYDGTLYRQYEGCKIVANLDDFVVVLLMKTKVQEADINW